MLSFVLHVAESRRLQVKDFFCEVVVRLEPNRDEGRRRQLMSIVQIRDLEKANGVVFIGPESDHWLCLSLTD